MANNSVSVNVNDLALVAKYVEELTRYQSPSSLLAEAAVRLCLRVEAHRQKERNGR